MASGQRAAPGAGADPASYLVPFQDASTTTTQPAPPGVGATMPHAVLASGAGLCDATAFADFSGLSVAHVAGNIDLLGVTLAGDQPHVPVAGLALLVFLTAVGVTPHILSVARQCGIGLPRAGVLG